MKNRRCIGVFLGQPNEGYQHELLSGIAKEAFQMDFNVAVFCTQKFSGGQLDIEAEHRIAELANFDLLDAVIVVPDTIRLVEEIRPEYTLDLIRKNFKGPKVSIDAEAEGFESFSSDDKETISHIVSHLIEKHDCTDIAFMTGIEGHPHSIERLEGFYQAMEKHGLTWDEDRIFYGDFWYNEGARVVDELLHSEKGLPQAIACASEEMAASVYTALTKHGIHIPDEVIVTGFDCPASSKPGDSTLTSAVRNVSEMVSRAMAYIRKELNIKGSTAINTSERLILNHSCGCQVEAVDIINRKVQEEDTGFFSYYNFMAPDLASAKNLEDCLYKISYYAEEENPAYLRNYEHLRICLRPDWHVIDQDTEKAFTDTMLQALDKTPPSSGNASHVVTMDWSFDLKKELYPGFGNVSNKLSITYFHLLNFGHRFFGYVAINFTKDSPEILLDDIYKYWVRNVNSALESLRRLYAMEELYVKAEKRSVTDFMTNLYNRNGYNRMLPRLINELRENEKLVFMLFDNNGLKYINDTYGHVAGDDVICVSTQVMSRRYFPNAREELNFRVGGDEYVKVVVGEIEEEDAQACMDKIQETLEEINAGFRRYPIYLAGGYMLYNQRNITSPDKMMTLVDQKMYEHKERMKEETGFRPERKK